MSDPYPLTRRHVTAAVALLLLAAGVAPLMLACVEKAQASGLSPEELVRMVGAPTASVLVLKSEMGSEMGSEFLDAKPGTFFVDPRGLLPIFVIEGDAPEDDSLSSPGMSDDVIAILAVGAALLVGLPSVLIPVVVGQGKNVRRELDNMRKDALEPIRQELREVRGDVNGVRDAVHALGERVGKLEEASARKRRLN